MRRMTVLTKPNATTPGGPLHVSVNMVTREMADNVQVSIPHTKKAFTTQGINLYLLYFFIITI
jgi:hypothetical protein